MLSIKPNENGTAYVTLRATDIPITEEELAAGEGAVLALEDLINPQWQLMKPNGEIVNNRSFGNSPITSLSWVLSGADLAYDGGSDIRIVAVQFSYNSGVGVQTPVTFEEYFRINKLISQTPS